MPTSSRGMPWLPMPIIGGGTPPVLPAIGRPVEEANKYSTVRDNNLAPDLIFHGVNTGDEVFIQPPDDAESKVLEYDAATTESAEMSSKDYDMQPVTAESTDVDISANELNTLVSLPSLPEYDDDSLSANNWIKQFILQPSPESDMNIGTSWLDDMFPRQFLPESTNAQTVETVLAEHRDAVCATQELL